MKGFQFFPCEIQRVFLTINVWNYGHIFTLFRMLAVGLDVSFRTIFGFYRVERRRTYELCLTVSI